ncbi:MAG: hypothetical protein K2L72_06335 [Clostridia bacterium]|nr:hypothetical protein [Clostridia bacterium]
MEEICTKLSATLSKDGAKGYGIYYEEELLDALPDDMRNRETLEAALKNLQSGAYIDVKYARGDAFCIASLKKYKPVEREIAVDCDNTAVCPTASLPKKIYAVIALCAFAGGALGGCVAAIAGAVL